MPSPPPYGCFCLCLDTVGPFHKTSGLLAASEGSSSSICCESEWPLHWLELDRRILSFFFCVCVTVLTGVCEAGQITWWESVMFFFFFLLLWHSKVNTKCLMFTEAKWILHILVSPLIKAAETWKLPLLALSETPVCWRINSDAVKWGWNAPRALLLKSGSDSFRLVCSHFS